MRTFGLFLSAFFFVTSLCHADETAPQLQDDSFSGRADLACKYNEELSKCEGSATCQLNADCMQIFSVSFDNQDEQTDNEGKRFWPTMIVKNFPIAGEPTVVRTYADSAREYRVSENQETYRHLIVLDNEGRSTLEYTGLNTQISGPIAMTGKYKWTTQSESGETVAHLNTFSWTCYSSFSEQDKYFETLRWCNRF